MANEFNVLNPNLLFDFNAVVPGGLGIFKIILNQNPLLYYRFQEDSGLVVNDSSGNGNAGTATSSGITRQQTPPVAEVTDFAYLFDGVDGFITTPSTSPTLSQNFTEFTVECWIKIPFLPASEETLVGKGDGPGNDHFQLALAPDGRIKFWFSDNTALKIAYSPTVVQPNSWVYIMAVWDGTQNVVYLNTEAGEIVANVVAPVTSAEDIQVAAYNSAGRFNGLIDELALYDTALLQEDAEDRYLFDNSDNTIPVINSATANAQSGGTLNIFQGDTVTFEINATDDDGDTLQYSFSPDGFIPSIGPQLGNSTTYQYTDTGVFNPVAFVTDLKSNRAAPFPVINVDPVPDLLAFNDSFTTGYQEARTLNVLANDSFPAGGAGSIQSFTQGQNGTVALQGSGETATLLYTPANGFDGEDFFTYTITDGSFGTQSALVTITVAEKQPPTANTYTTKIEPNTIDNIIVPQVNDTSDPPGEDLTLISVQNPTAAGNTAILDTDNNYVLYTPATDFLGADSFSYVVSDEAGLTSVGLVSISVETLVYEAIDDNATVPYEQSVTISVLANDVTPFPDPLSVQSVTQPPIGEGVVTIVGGATQVFYDAAGTGFFGNTSFTYTSTDGTRTDTANVNINVVERPPIATDDRLSTPINTAVSLDVMSNDYDPEGLPISLISFTQGSDGSVAREENGSPGDLTDDTLLYTPDPAFEGVDSFTYTIEDAVGQQDTATCFVAVGFILEISSNKDFAPVTESFAFFANPTAATGYDKSYTYFWDFDDGNTSTQRNPTHQFTGIGVFNVSCQVTDSYGAVKTEFLSIEVIANKRPVAVDDNVEVAEGQVLNFDPRVNDFDEDGDQFFISDADAFSAQGGIVSINNNGTPGNVYDDFITYVHPAIATPFVDTFDYEISDEFGLTDTATITVTVLENLAPIAQSVFATTVYEESTLVDVITPAVDPEGDDLTVNTVSSVSSGNAVVVTPLRKLIQYTPANGFLGQATFDFTIIDDFANTDQDQVTVSVFGQYYPKRVVQDEPLSFYNFNEPESQGTIAYDVMPAAWHGTYVNNVKRDGQLGPLAQDLENCANVDQGYISIGTQAHTFADEFSLEFWVRNSNSGSSSLISPIFSVSADGSIYQFTLTTDVDSALLTFTGQEIDEWYYFVITYDGQFLRGYQDLQLVTSAPLTGNVLLPVKIFPGLGMSGDVGPLAIYDKVLTLTDIQDHYAEAEGAIVSYDVYGPDFVAAGDEFNVTARSRDITGKRVITNNTEDVTFTSDDPAIEFDADGDGNFNEP